jgi:hypothetical protein
MGTVGACNRSFTDDAVYKKRIERDLYTKAAANMGMQFVDPVIVAGPDIVRHLQNARGTVARGIDNHIRIVDVDDSVIKEKMLPNLAKVRPIDALWQSYSPNFPAWPGNMAHISHNVSFINDDIRNHTSLFVDADLMESIVKAGPVLEECLRKQRQTFPMATNQIKGFIFTVSIRAKGGARRAIRWVIDNLVKYIDPMIEFDVDYSKKKILTVDRKCRLADNGSNAVYVSTLDPGINQSPSMYLVSVNLWEYSERGGAMLTGLITYF